MKARDKKQRREETREREKNYRAKSLEGGQSLIASCQMCVWRGEGGQQAGRSDGG